MLLKGRAAWLEEGRALQMIPDATTSSTITSKEEMPLIDDNVCRTNDRTEAVPTAVKVADDFLLSQAKQNVEDRRNLKKHVVMFFAGWLVWTILLAAFFDDAKHPSFWQVSSALKDWQISIAGNEAVLPVNTIQDLDSAFWLAEYHLGAGYTHPMFYVTLGVMIAWSGWIAFRISKYVSKRHHLNSRKRHRPDPVIKEYNRLKSMASDGIV